MPCPHASNVRYPRRNGLALYAPVGVQRHSSRPRAPAAKVYTNDGPALALWYLPGNNPFPILDGQQNLRLITAWPV